MPSGDHLLIFSDSSPFPFLKVLTLNDEAVGKVLSMVNSFLILVRSNSLVFPHSSVYEISFKL